MPHWERKRWCEEISSINSEKNAGEGGQLDPDPQVDDIPLNDPEDFFEPTEEG